MARIASTLLESQFELGRYRTAALPSRDLVGSRLKGPFWLDAYLFRFTQKERVPAITEPNLCCYSMWVGCGSREWQMTTTPLMAKNPSQAGMSFTLPVRVQRVVDSSSEACGHFPRHIATDAMTWARRLSWSSVAWAGRRLGPSRGTVSTVSTVSSSPSLLKAEYSDDR